MIPKIKILMDSGAFSAWKLGKPIRVEDYCAFLRQNSDWITDYINLDEIIPGDPEEAARRSEKNLEYMMAEGFSPMPVFHIGEDIKWLQRMIDAGHPYICLAGLSAPSRDSSLAWYSFCWSHMVNRDGLPVVKVHALGEGRRAPLLAYPWCSADSTSWAYQAQRYAKVTLSDGSKVSLRKDGQNDAAAPDIRMLDDANREALHQLLREEGIRQDLFNEPSKTSWLVFAYMMVLYYKRLEAEVNARRPIIHHPSGFFHAGYSSKPAVDFDEFRFYLVRSNNNCAPALFLRAKMLNILISYYYMPNVKSTGMLGGGGAGAKMNSNFMRDFLANPMKVTTTYPLYRQHWDALEASLE